LQVRSKKNKQEEQARRTSKKNKQINPKKKEYYMNDSVKSNGLSEKALSGGLWIQERATTHLHRARVKKITEMIKDDRGDVPGWVLVVLMTTGLVTAIWTIAAPRLSAILKNSLDAMNGIR
jgi:hypothetical protein